jgi:uncharacterized membrane protein
MKLGRLAMGLLYVAAGAAHFLLTRTYERIVPDYLPAHRELVIISGIAEIAGGVGVLLPRTQKAAAWGIIALLVAVFPANITMLQHHDRFPGIPVWLLWIRLPLQGILIGWAWRYARASGKARSSELSVS